MTRRDVHALLCSVVLLGIATAGVLTLKARLAFADWGATVIVMLTPVVVYGVLPGRLTEFGAPGGWIAKFKEEAHSGVEFDQAALTPSTTDMQMIPKESPAQLKLRVGLIHDGRPVVLTLTVGKGNGAYEATALRDTLKVLAQFRNFKFVLFLDSMNKLVAYTPAWALQAALDRTDGSDALLISAINEGLHAELKACPGAITEFVTTDSTNVEALAMMERFNLEALVIVDRASQEPRGVAERDRILCKMILALVTASKKSTAA